MNKIYSSGSYVNDMISELRHSL